MSIGDNIRKLRESHGLTQSQLGDAIGVSDKAVSTWESGNREPRQASVSKIAHYFGINEGELRYGDGDHFHRLPGGYATSSFIISALLENPPSSDVVSPLFEYYSKETTPGEQALTEGEKTLLELFRKIPAEQQEMVLQMIRAALSAAK